MKILYAHGKTAAEIADSLLDALRNGTLQPGDTLPAVRALALQLAVNPNTVAAAYARLRDGGRVVTDGRRGTRVVAPPASMPQAYAVPEGLHDLASGNVDASLLPQLQGGTAAWVAQASSARYEATADLPALQAEARQWFTAQGVACGEIGVFSGTLDVVERALRVHAHPGDRVAVEDPCWPPLVALLHSLRLKPVPLPVDDQGLCVPDAGVLKGCAALVLTPRAHNPTGAAISPARWKALRRQLQHLPHLLVVLDDHWGPLSAAPLAMAASLPALWLHVLSVSKFLGPDLRVAVATGTPALVQALRAQQALGPRWVSCILQGLAAGLWRQMREGKRSALAQAGMSYAARRQALVQALAAQHVTVAPGEGLHLWLPVVDEVAVVQFMASRGWAVQAGSPLRMASSPAVRVSLGECRPLVRACARRGAPCSSVPSWKFVDEVKRSKSSSGKAQTAAIAGAIARICNAAWRRFRHLYETNLQLGTLEHAFRIPPISQPTPETPCPSCCSSWNPTASGPSAGWLGGRRPMPACCVLARG